MGNRNHLWLGAAAFPIVLMFAGPAFAQTTGSEEASASDEIVVTATKREESLNEVGLTITAATGEALIDRGINGPEDLAALVPGFTFTQSLYSTPVFTLRGIGLYDATFGAPPSVSIYTNEIPRNVPVMSEALGLDIARVEVIKGPQGTLFGQSSTGGAINYIVNRPTHEFEAGLTASYESFERGEISGYISGPLGDHVAARLAISTENGGAWQRSLSRPNNSNGDDDVLMGRFTLDIDPTEDVSFQFTLTGVQNQSDPQAPQYAGTLFNVYSAAALAAANGNPATANPFGFVDEARYDALTNPTSPGYDSTFLGRQAVVVGRLNGVDPVAAANAAALLGTPISDNARDAEWTPGLLGPSDNSYGQFAVRADFDLSDSVTLTSISAYATADIEYSQDLDGTTAQVVDVPLYGGVETFNQEIRLSGSTTNIDWIIGASYDDVQTDQNNFFRLSDYSGNLGLITLTLNNYTSQLNSYGLFGNVDYQLSDRITLHGGARFTNTEQDATYCYNDPAIDVAQGTAFVFGAFLNIPPITINPGECFPIDTNFHSSITPVSYSLAEDNVSYRFGADYQFEQGTLLYAVLSRGFKAGTFSAIGASSQTQYTPALQEELNAYEAGIKAPLWDGLLQFNAAAFFYDYSDKQVRGRILDPVFGLLEKMLNVPESEIMGIEAELLFRPFEGLNMSLSATHLDSEVTGSYSQTPDGLAVYNAAGYTGDFRGSQLPYTPELSAVFDAQYRFDVSTGLEAFVGTTVTYQGEQNATFTNGNLEATDFVTPEHTLVDVRAGIESMDGHWRVMAFGRNVTDESYITSVSTFLDTLIRYTGQPSIYGVSLSYSY